MTEAYIVDAVRTPVGKRNGGLSGAHPADMAAHVIKTLVGRHDFDPAAIDDVIFGCLDNIGSQAGDIARTAALAAGLPESVPHLILRPMRMPTVHPLRPFDPGSGLDKNPLRPKPCLRVIRAPAQRLMRS